MSPRKAHRRDRQRAKKPMNRRQIRRRRRATPSCEAVGQAVVPCRVGRRGTRFSQQSLLHKRPQVSLERPPGCSGAELLVIVNRQAPMLDDVAQRDSLPFRQRVLPHQGVPADCVLSAYLYLVELGGQPCREELEPAREVHVPFAHGSDRPVEGGPVPVVVLADGEEALEVVPGFVQAQSRKQARGAAVAVQEGVDVDQPELGDSADQHRMDIAFPVQPVDQLPHQDRHVVRRRRRVDDLSGAGVHHVVLDPPVLARRGGSAADALDEAPVDFADQSLGGGVSRSLLNFASGRLPVSSANVTPLQQLRRRAGPARRGRPPGTSGRGSPGPAEIAVPPPPARSPPSVESSDRHATA